MPNWRDGESLAIPFLIVAQAQVPALSLGSRAIRQRMCAVPTKSFKAVFPGRVEGFSDSP